MSARGIVMENAYLCPKCDYVSSIPKDTTIGELKCQECDYDECVYAIHINNGTRKRWIEIERSSPWKLGKKIQKSLKNDLCKDKLWRKRLDEITNQIFALINESEPDDLFPQYRVDYPRMKDKIIRLKRGENAKLTKRGSIRGELYESAFLKVIDNIPNIERGLELVENTSGRKCRPDAWISFGPKNKYPVEFKTVKQGNFLLNGISAHLKQSRMQGKICSRADLNNKDMSMLIVCSPEERIFCGLLLDKKIEGRINHLTGRPSQKRMSREKNRKSQDEARQKRRQRSLRQNEKK